MTGRKVDFTVACVDCGKPEKIHDYLGRWKTGEYRCSKCFDIWYKKQPPIELKLYDMMTNELVATRTYER